MLSWLAPLVVLGLVVFVHEFGHFAAAKLLGVYAPRFSLGWGKALVRWRRKGSETEYVISALPIGGYVRMASRADETAAVLEGGNEQLKEGAEQDPRWDPEAMIPHGPHPVPADRWFESKPTWARVIILLAGVTMNVVLALVVSTGVYAVYGRYDAPTVIDTVLTGLPADRAGLRKGDSVTAVDGVSVRAWGDLVDKISASPGKAIRLDVSRGTDRLTLTATPDSLGKIGAGALAPDRIGNRAVRKSISLGASMVAGWHATWSMAGAVLGVLGGLLKGTVSVKTLGGPIAIARISVAAAQTGLEPLFSLIAFLSINLAVLNLLPIPILDGGQILITVAEGVKGKPFSDRSRDNFMKVGLVVIGALFVLVMFNDLKALVMSIFA
jgi:regulator of sigma E protease